MGLKSWWQRLRGADEPEGPPVPAAPTEQDILAALNRVNAMLRDGNAPPVVTSRVVRIARTINATLPRLRQLGQGSLEAYSVVATATDYLPEAVGGYLRLPREWADTRPIDGYKTSLMVLIDQLDLLGATMDKIFDAANRADAQALVLHGKFLEAKFGHGRRTTSRWDPRHEPPRRPWPTRWPRWSGRPARPASTPATARAEGESLAATLSERSRGAFIDWCEQTGRERSAEEHQLAAKQGNRFRGGPTPLDGPADGRRLAARRRRIGMPWRRWPLPR